ncbi:MAG TPA: hypothetical protein VFK44_00075 [Bacillales bacterium]|nr:hypothetical protein [Bacillales bacterium]
MGYSHSNHHNPSMAVNSLNEECIRVPKVYDWVTDTLTVSKNIRFNDEQMRRIEEAMADPSRRPLRIVTETPYIPPLFSLCRKHHDNNEVLCEQVGEKRDVTVPLSGQYVDAQLVDLLFTADVRTLVVDRHGCEVADISANVSIFDSFVLCYPDGTELMCNITRIVTRVPSGTVLLNAPCPSSFTLEVTFCVDIQVEAEVKLEVLAKFCSPRENNLTAPETIEQCPTVEFPKQCPDIFPRPNCDCSAQGQASGNTGTEATERGEAGIDVDICPNCSLNNSSLAFTFHDTDTEDGQNNFDFQATSFDQDTLKCSKDRHGTKLTISGTGETNRGKSLDFNLALVDNGRQSKFQIELINDRNGETVFDSGPVQVTEGSLEVDDCRTFEEIKYKRRP